MARGAGARNLPPHHPEARTAASAYRLDEIIPPMAVDSLQTDRVFKAAQNDEVYKKAAEKRQVCGEGGAGILEIGDGVGVSEGSRVFEAAQDDAAYKRAAGERQVCVGGRHGVLGLGLGCCGVFGSVEWGGVGLHARDRVHYTAQDDKAYHELLKLQGSARCAKGGGVGWDDCLGRFPLSVPIERPRL